MIVCKTKGCWNPAILELEFCSNFCAMQSSGNWEGRAYGKSESLETPKTVSETLEERAKTHGDFEKYANIMIELIDTVDLNGNEQLTAVQHQGLYMILSKITRIVNGDANHIDSWHDIAGYASLVERSLKNE